MASKRPFLAPGAIANVFEPLTEAKGLTIDVDVRSHLAELLGKDFNNPSVGEIIDVAQKVFQREMGNDTIIDPESGYLTWYVVTKMRDAVIECMTGDSAQVRAMYFALAETPRDWPIFCDFLDDHNIDTEYFRSPQFAALWESMELEHVIQAQALNGDRRESQHAMQFGKPPPLTAVLRAFSLAQLEVTKDFQEPRLILVPPISLFHTGVLLNDRTGFYATYSGGPPKRSEYAYDAWHAFIMEGKEKMAARNGDSRNARLGERVDIERQIMPAVCTPMDRCMYTALQRESLDRGRRLDVTSTAILVADRLTLEPNSRREGVSIGALRPNEAQLEFSVYLRDTVDLSACIRRATGGPVMER